MNINTIWKFELAVTDRQTIDLPIDYVTLSVGLDPQGALCIWVAVDDRAAKRPVEFIIVGTGNPMPHVGSFIGSVKMGPFMWHVFTGPGSAANRATEFHYLTKDNG